MGDHIEKRSSRILSSRVELHTNLEEFLGCLERNGYHKQDHNQRREGVMCLRYTLRGTKMENIIHIQCFLAYQKWQ